jgi:thiamine pyrophosphokinase
MEGCFYMKTTINRIVLFANGVFYEPEKLLPELKDDDYLIAVDGGLRYFTPFALVPDLIIGDLDSADPEDVQRFKTQGVEVRQYPIEKNETDLELALLFAYSLHPESIWIVAALGGRLDQTLASIYLLTSPDLINCDVRLVDGRQEVLIIQNTTSLSGKTGDRVSLLPLKDAVTGVTTRGLNYPLKGETLYPHQSRGVSNHMTGKQAQVIVQQGLLLCIHERSGKNV